MSYRHFERFCNGKCKFGELTLKLGERYMMYLTTQARAMKPRYERLGTNTAATYFAVFKKVLRMAYQERMIRDNLVDRLGVPAMAAGGCASYPKISITLTAESKHRIRTRSSF